MLFLAPLRQFHFLKDCLPGTTHEALQIKSSKPFLLPEGRGNHSLSYSISSIKQVALEKTSRPAPSPFPLPIKRTIHCYFPVSPQSSVVTWPSRQRGMWVEITRSVSGAWAHKKFLHMSSHSPPHGFREALTATQTGGTWLPESVFGGITFRSEQPESTR